MKSLLSSNALRWMTLVGICVLASVIESTATPLVETKSLSFAAAQSVAEATLEAGRVKSCAIAVAVVDAAGIALVQLRLDGGTQQFVEGALAKAWTAVNLRDSTRALVESIEKGVGDSSQLPNVEGALLLMGGLPLRAGVDIVGGIGVAGCPDGPDDDALAHRGAKAFDELLKAR